MARARIGGLLLCYAGALYFQAFRNGWLHWGTSLPLQLCDWVLIACLVTLIRPNHLAAEIAYFWGLGGTLQAVLTPDMTQGFPSWRFLQFFWGMALRCSASCTSSPRSISGRGPEARCGC